MTDGMPPNTAMSEDEIREILNMPDIPTHIQFDLDDQTVDALDLMLHHLRMVPSRPRSWKWVLLGAHAALHGGFSLVLERTDGYQLYNRKTEKRLQENLYKSRQNPENSELLDAWVEIIAEDPKIDEFMDLFTKACNPKRVMHLASVPLRPSKAQAESVQRLNTHRGLLVHFSRTSLVLDTDEMLELADHSVEIVKILLTRTQYMSGEVCGGPIRTISDPDLADEADRLLGELESESRSARSRCDELG